MSRKYNQTSIEVLKELSEKPTVSIRLLFDIFGKDKPFKDFYNLIFRLESQGLLKKEGKKLASITPEGTNLLLRLAPKTDGVWKIVIFDIPEKHQKVRNILRGKLKQLYFKKWQNSIWISPYILPEDIEEEFRSLGQKFFIRLIKTSDINIVEDLKNMFKI